jgi:flagella basal body P-ring formation protein FlgA
MIRVGFRSAILLFLGISVLFAQENAFGKDGLQKQITAYFAQRFEYPDSLVKVTFSRLPDMRRFQGDDYQIEFRTSRERIRLGFQTVWMHVLRYGQPIQKIPVGVTVQLKMPVVVTTQKVNFHERIRANMVRMERRWVKNDDVWQEGLRTLAEAIDRESSHFLAAGKVLLQRDVQAVNVVRPGDRVEIRVPAGNLVVTTKGIARSAGKIGDFIYVKNLTTGKRLKARVQAPGIVVVEEKRAL